MSDARSFPWVGRFQLCRVPSPAVLSLGTPVWVIGNINYEYDYYYFAFMFGPFSPGSLYGENAIGSASIDGIDVLGFAALCDGATGPVYGLYMSARNSTTPVGDGNYHTIAWSAGNSGEYSWVAGSFSIKLENWGDWVDAVPYLEP